MTATPATPAATWTRRRLLGATAGLPVLATGLLLPPSGAAAADDDYPAEGVELVVGFAAGGGTDVMARLLADKLRLAWNQPFVVSNRPGAGGNIATQRIAQSTRGGYTLLVAVSSLAINPTLYKNLTFDVLRDLAPISLLSISSNVIACRPGLAAANLGEVLALARTGAGRLSYASPGVGQASHLAMELLCSRAGVKMVHVPYNNSPQANQAAVTGEVDLIVNSLPTTVPFLKAGTLRALAVTTAKRSAYAPEIPTVTETTGIADYDANVWYGLLAPAATPRPVIEKLSLQVASVLQQPDVQERLLFLGFEAAASTPEAFGALIRSDMAKWGEVVRASGAHAD